MFGVSVALIEKREIEVVTIRDMVVPTRCVGETADSRHEIHLLTIHRAGQGPLHPLFNDDSSIVFLSH